MNELVNLIIVLAILIIAWLVLSHFSPHPLITQIAKIIIFIIALLVVVRMVLPMAGVSF